ncbi:HTTM domain-containing protein [Rubinisphaera brasiliensis]|uniref:HTTM domain-containing protein n=1 Tax=Rubinisphaera brasiliensis (strain ATCC 49424 / DSM 5305 / JCM 21570 / IAM 15109 / NBRC 103401 / IFAM 1448) TaxID=756272 RepID=F0SJV8_RUBBR|nr:HTTM domain-containing protein [Rubinisphaera brasiliensis]ADY58647.1 hypothetical protein Plabr_1026 [Rubinisphaera brasiliensis DSM 5305]
MSLLVEQTVSTPADSRRPREAVRSESASCGVVNSLTLFGSVWALVTLIHLLSLPFWARTWQGWALVLATGLLLLAPQSRSRFAAFIALALANLFRAMPFVPNHVLFEGMINVTILLSLGWTSRKSLLQADMIPHCRQFVRHRWRELLFLAGYFGLIFVWQNERLGGIATGIALGVLHARKFGERPADELNQTTFDHFAPIVRWQMVVMYVWAAVQKMNWDYLNPEVSAAATLHREIASFLPFIPAEQWALNLAIYGSLICELGIPVLLLFSATRRWGITIAIVFHAFLALHPHPGIYSFSALIYGLLFLFLSPEAQGRLANLWQRQWNAVEGLLPERLRAVPAGMLPVVLFFTACIVYVACYRILGETRETFEVVNRIGFGIWATLSFWLGYCYLRVLWARPEFDRAVRMRLVWSPALLGLLLVVANGFSPWVGFKTQTSFSMFSNLRTEFAANHLFLKRVRLFNYQDDMVQVIEAEPNILVPIETPQSIEKFANAGSILPFFELRRLLSSWEGDVRLQIQRHGEVVEVTRIDGETNLPEAFEPLNLAERKLLWFRRHQAWDGPMLTTH